jgi:BioD-like phosphotransacetylase family protein
VSLALVATNTLTTVTRVVQLINTLVLNGNHRNVCMYANVNFISCTKLVCENVVFSEPCCLENKCDVGKAF